MSSWRRVGLPLALYWGMTLAVPLLNGRGVDGAFPAHAAATLALGAALGAAVLLVSHKK